MDTLGTQRSVEVDRPPLLISIEVAKSLRQVLATIRSRLGMDVAFVSEFLGSNRIFHAVDSLAPVPGLAAGAMLPMAAGYCRDVVAGILPQLIPDTSKVPLAQEIEETQTIPIGAHLSVPIETADGRIFGTFCCFSHRAMPELGVADLQLVQTFSSLVAVQLSEEVRRICLQASRAAAEQALTADGRPLTLAELLKATPQPDQIRSPGQRR